MSWKDKIENSPVLIVLAAVLSGFVSGVGAMTFLEKREEDLRAKIMAELKQENATLKASNEELDRAVRQILIKYVDLDAISKGKPLGGENSVVPKVRDEILGADRGEISHIIKDPAKILRW